MQTGHVNGKAGADVLPSTPAPSDPQTALPQHPQATTVPPDLVSRLYEPLPREAVTPHPTKTYLSSIKAIFQIERLNQVFGLGGWSYSTHIVREETLPATEKQGPRCMVVMKVRLRVPAYNIRLEQYGGSDNEDYGDAYKGAVTDALGKLCGYMGIGIDVYKGDGPTRSNPQGKTRPQPRPPATAATPEPKAPTPAPPEPQKYWHTVGEMRRLFEQIREQIGEITYLRELDKWNARSVDDFLKIRPATAATETARRCYGQLLSLAGKEAA